MGEYLYNRNQFGFSEFRFSLFISRLVYFKIFIGGLCLDVVYFQFSPAELCVLHQNFNLVN